MTQTWPEDKMASPLRDLQAELKSLGLTITVARKGHGTSLTLYKVTTDDDQMIVDYLYGIRDLTVWVSGVRAWQEIITRRGKRAGCA